MSKDKDIAEEVNRLKWGIVSIVAALVAISLTMQATMKELNDKLERIAVAMEAKHE